MKKVILFLVIFLPFTSYAKTDKVIVDFKHGKMEVFVPTDYKSLRANFIAMAKALATESHEHNLTLINYKQALRINKNLAIINYALIEKLKGILENNSYRKVDPLKSYILFGSGIYFDTDNTIKYSGTVGYQLIIYDRYLVNVNLSTPLSLSLNLGFKIW